MKKYVRSIREQEEIDVCTYTLHCYSEYDCTYKQTHIFFIVIEVKGDICGSFDFRFSGVWEGDIKTI